MIRLTGLEYWHSFRPPHRNSLYVAPDEVSSIRELPYDERRSETASEVVMKDGRKYLVEGRPNEIAATLASEEPL